MSARIVTLIACDAPDCDEAIEQEDRFTPPEWYYLSWMSPDEPCAHYCSAKCLRAGVQTAQWEPAYER